MFEDDWEFPIVDGKNGDAGLVYSNLVLVSLSCSPRRNIFQPASAFRTENGRLSHIIM